MSDPLLHELHRRFDHAALKPDVTAADIGRLCAEARAHEFCGVAVNPVWIPLCGDHLRGTGVKVIGVAAFPLGANRTDVKVEEAVKGAADGAREIDLVAKIGWLVEGRCADVAREISAVRRALPYNVLLKVIIEAGLLPASRWAEAAQAVIDGGAQFVKTGTGFFGGATVEQVRALSRAAGGRIEVKASGGIRTLADARAMLAAGASRLGSSASVAIMRELASPEPGGDTAAGSH